MLSSQITFLFSTRRENENIEYYFDRSFGQNNNNTRYYEAVFCQFLICGAKQCQEYKRLRQLNWLPQQSKALIEEI